MGFWPISDRSILIKLEGKPFNISIIQVYAPTQDHGDEEIEAFYEEIEKAIKIVKSDEVLIVMGDWNAKVGDEPIPGVMGRFGLGNQNERGQRLQQFCMEKPTRYCEYILPAKRQENIHLEEPWRYVSKSNRLHPDTKHI